MRRSLDRRKLARNVPLVDAVGIADLSLAVGTDDLPRAFVIAPGFLSAAELAITGARLSDPCGHTLRNVPRGNNLFAGIRGRMVLTLRIAIAGPLTVCNEVGQKTGDPRIQVTPAGRYPEPFITVKSDIHN